MTRAEAWLQHGANVLVGGTGLVYAWMRYFAEPSDPYAIVNHPAEPHVQHLHVLAAPLLVFACGLIWPRHVWARVRAGFPVRRRTGLALFASFVPMAASGYLVQVTVEEAWRDAWIVVHVATSLLWVLGYALHQLGRRPARPSAAVAATAGPTATEAPAESARR